jgi:sorbitol-specific phosphotransferase system component IIA
VKALPVVRPKVAELIFQLYGRALHPELFEVHQTRVVQRGGYSARVEITNAGHLVTWRYEGTTLAEVAAAANHPLPQRRRLLSHRLHGQRTDEVKCRGGCSYQVNFQLEPLDPSLFWSLQKQLVEDGQRQGMLHTFDSSGRVSLGAISYIHLQTRDRSFLVQAVHTFPDDNAIVKSQSLFRLPD